MVDPGEGLGLGTPDLGRGRLVPRGAVGAQEVAQEAETFWRKMRHGGAP